MINWDIVPDDEIQRQQNELVALFPDITVYGLTEPASMRKLLNWIESVDLIKDDDDVLGKYNWSYTAKHIAERALKTYVSNGQLVLAAIMCGYMPSYIRATNCDFKRGWWYEQ